MSTKPIFFLSLYLLLWYLLLCLAVYLFSGVIFTQTRVSQTQMLQAQAQTQMLQARVPQTQVPQTQVLQVQAHAQTQEVQEAESTYARLPIRQIEIRTDSANNSKLIARFKVEIADTPQAQRRGLMFRTKMPANEGMLFIFPYPRVASLWMRNTLLPLDMI
ncbi:MAG: DUF192 domain-containing protein, partial [Alphaproteobacteria bacterium]|nr:DUF192 domain-containing protein [Alphaproteobacteria bacterium]